MRGLQSKPTAGRVSKRLLGCRVVVYMHFFFDQLGPDIRHGQPRWPCTTRPDYPFMLCLPSKVSTIRSCCPTLDMLS